MPRMGDLMKKSPGPYVRSREKRVEEIAEKAPAEPPKSEAEKDHSNNVSRETLSNSSSEKLNGEPIRETPSEPAAEPRKTTRPVGRPAAGRTAQLTLMMDPTLKKSLKKYCVDQGKSVAAVIEDLVRDLLSQSRS